MILFKNLQYLYYLVNILKLLTSFDNIFIFINFICSIAWQFLVIYKHLHYKSELV